MSSRRKTKTRTTPSKEGTNRNILFLVRFTPAATNIVPPAREVRSHKLDWSLRRRAADKGRRPGKTQTLGALRAENRPCDGKRLGDTSPIEDWASLSGEREAASPRVPEPRRC